MSAPQSSGGRESEVFSTSEVEWIEPVFGADVSGEPERPQTDEVPARATPELTPSHALPRATRPRRGRRSPASHAMAAGTTARPVKWHGWRPDRHSSVPATTVPTAAASPTVFAHGANPFTLTNRLEAIGPEREAAASALAALQGTLAAGVLAALHETLAAERDLAMERIARLGAERAAASAQIAPSAGTAVAHTAPVHEVSDAASLWAAISLLWRRDEGARQSLPAGPGSALPGSALIVMPSRELTAWHAPDAGAAGKWRRRLAVNAFALLVATAAVATYYSRYGGDIWPAAMRPTQSGAADPAVTAVASPATLPSDPVQRAAYFRDRAEAGEAAAQYALGILYAQGDGVAQNYATAASWFEKAAKGGVVNAQDLAALYRRGLATPQDYVVAAYWYRNAAERGVEAAMPMLALLYERGEGVKTSPTGAYGWYRAAARRGDALAGKRAAALFTQLDGAEKGRAVVRAAEIVAALHERRPAPSASATLVPGDWIGGTTDRPGASTD